MLFIFLFIFLFQGGGISYFIPF